MYSVEDLLISHGYKLPKHATSSTPTPTPAPSSHQPRSSSPPSYSKHHEILENRSGPRTVNGYERGPVVAYGNGSGTRQPQVYDAGGCPNNNESRDRSQPRREGENRGQTDTHSLGESLTSDIQAQAQVQARSREREAALHQWRMATERKCQSLGTDEWRPAVSFGSQLSQSEGERWAQEQQRLHARTPEGMVVHPRTKAKSQSLPRMLQPESLQFVEIPSSGQDLYRRVNGNPFLHHDLYRAPRWPENGRPASANQLSMTPKPRFTRPPRPPSYEMHQQIRGSCEVLSGRDSTIPQSRDRTPLPISRPGDPQLDYFAQDSGPPGYIPPPSYKRHIQVAPDGSHWFTRHPAGPWPDSQRERSMSSQKQLYPVYTTQEHPGGGVQYIPFDDPRIRHISSALGGNSLTDADKIRHIRNELPSVTVSEPAPDDSAFLPPPLGPFIAAKLADNTNQTSSSDFDNDNKRWHSNLHKETVDNFPAPDQNCNNRYPKNQRPPPSPSSAFQTPLTRISSRHGSSSDQVFAETITQVKKIVPDSGPENNRNTKRRVSETIFCLVSVPVHTPTNINKDFAADQNNNETIPSLTVTNTETFAVGLKESPNIRSKSVNEMPIKSHYSRFHTSSTSSMRNYKRAPLRKEIIDAWTLQANEDKELCYAGSWPGNQYRNQETQTGSPLTVVKSPELQSPPDGQGLVQSASDAATDSGVVTDSSSSYGYPMTGQKNLHPSSNSAFSRLSLSPTEPPSLQPLQQDPSSPSKVQNQGDQQPSSPRKHSSPESAEQVVFGQFLLKPVNRRPCDAIGELESINKEMEDTISKRPLVAQCIDDLDGMNKRLARFKSGAHFMAGPEPGREAISLPPLHNIKPNSIKVRSKSLASTADLESMDMRSAFPRSQATNIPTTNDLSVCPNLGSRDNLSSVPPHNEANRHYRQDIPVPQESLLKDVGLTVYTETPGGPGEPMQRSLSVPSPLDQKDLSQSVELTWDIRTAIVKNSGSPEHNSNNELETEVNAVRKAESHNFPPFRGEVNLAICRTRSESSKSPQKDSSPHITRLTREVSFVFENYDGNERYAISEPLTYKNDSTITDKHLENLLIKEKANARPAEDLSNLYEVKCAKGIPENESIEQRAARILGIAVPVEALGVADKQSDDSQDDADTTAAEKQQSPTDETQQVKGECKQVKKESLIVQGTDGEEVKETESGVDQQLQQENNRQQHSNDHSDGRDNEDTETQLVLDLPEFPPSKLPLSLPISSDEKLALSICSWEKKGRGGACKLIESLQDKLNSTAVSSATCMGRSTTDRMARLKELDSVSRIRRLSLKGPKSGEEGDSQEINEDREECEVQEETKEDVVEHQLEKEEKEMEGEERKEKTPDEHDNSLYLWGSNTRNLNTYQTKLVLCIGHQHSLGLMAKFQAKTATSGLLF
uniref:Junctional cadherin 5 associated a n=1 Tax=Amphilophus citrinellus TaxID=61819 RepID=A0A3Q0S1G6_AMPCI